jgi:hypothetical protein
MRMIVYAGGGFVTGDEIATALLQYSCALGQQESAQIVEIPIVDDDGSPGTAQFLIGPASQIVVKSVRSSADELVDADVVNGLRRMTRGVSFPQASQLDERDRDPRTMSADDDEY